MKFLKPIILFVALLLPVCIFLFLKLFGHNQFDIPVYYQLQEEIPMELDCTNTTIKAPYTVEAETIELLNTGISSFVNKERITLLAFYQNNDVSQWSYKMKRLDERLGTNYQMIIFSDSMNLPSSNNQFASYNSIDEIKAFWKCSLLTSDYNQWVLLDSKNSIRGYYETSEEEMDRVIVEMTILIENKEKPNE